MNSQDKDTNTIGARIRGWFDVVGNGTAASILAVGGFLPLLHSSHICQEMLVF